MKYLKGKSQEYVYDMAKGTHAMMYKQCIGGISKILTESWALYHNDLDMTFN
jgi:hypothetical protein